MENLEQYDSILALIEKGAEEVIGMEELKEKLKHGKKLKVKLGLDPSAPDIHLGHTVVLRKLKAFQDLGHEVHIIIGDFTGRIGDPTGKSKSRVELSKEQVLENAKTYTDQIFKILDPDKTVVHFNSTWLEKMDLQETLLLMKTTTVARMMEREDFKKRFESGFPIGLNEFVYPLLQGYDSLMIEADVELGGTDQTFNLLMGRTLQKSRGQSPQTVLMMPLLEGLDGVEKMSKSLGNYVGIDEAPEVMFQKIMTLPDSLILKYFTLVTDLTPEEILHIETTLKEENPKNVKLQLSKLLTALYHGEEAAKEAEVYFTTVFTKEEIPENLPELLWEPSSMTLAVLLRESGYVESQNAFKRLLAQKGLAVNGEKISKEEELPAEGSFTLSIGKRTHVKIISA
jgi:tyrosyl-tRNA synthetase